MGSLSARFHKARNKGIRAVDKTFAEPIEFFPLHDGRQDNSRQKVVIEAPLRVNSGRATTPTGGVSGTWQSKIEAGKGKAHVDRTKYPSLVVYEGDKIRAISRPGQPYFEVKHVDDRNAYRLILEVNEA